MIGARSLIFGTVLGVFLLFSAVFLAVAFTGPSQTPPNGNGLISVSGSNVGIGTNTPNAPLSLGNGAQAQKMLLYDNNDNYKYGFGIQSNLLREFYPSNAAWQIGTISNVDGTTFSEKARIDASGNMGIGLNNPTVRLHLYRGGGLIIDNQSNTNFLQFFTDGNTKWTQYLVGNDLRFWEGLVGDRMTLKAGGNVGIGTTNPMAKLDVFNGWITPQSDVTTDTSANAGITWYTPTPNVYGIYRSAGGWAAPNYQQLTMTFATGIVIDGGNQYGKSGIVLEPAGGWVRFGGTLLEPTSTSQEGMIYYNSVSHSFRCYQGSPAAWTNCGGGATYQ